MQSNSDVIDVLFDFDEAEKSYTIETDKGRFTLEKTNETEKLNIAFESDVKISTVKIIPNTPLDWSGHENINIAVDLENTSDISTYFYIGFHDGSGNFQNKGMVVPANSKGTYYVVMDGPTRDIDSGLREVPPPWDKGETMMISRWASQGKNFNMDSISEIHFFTRGIITDKMVTIDNIRLRKNPPHPPNYMKGIVDKFGQNAQADFPIKVEDEAELRRLAEAELKTIKDAPVMADRSRYGGWKDGPQLKATGFFRTEKINGKWWLVDPDGYLFFSHGVANVRMANLSTLTGVDFKDESVRAASSEEVTPEDSIGFVTVSEKARSSRFISSEMRHDMFNWLPDYDDPLADHYSFRRSALMGPIDGGETYNFYSANLERRYGETSPQSYIKKWEQVTLDRMNSWGFTSFGNWVDPAFYDNEQVPYFANGWIIGDFQTLSSGNDVWGPTPDFFDPLFAARADITISTIANEIKGSPWCVGIFIDNEKSWGNPADPVEKRYGLITDALSKSVKGSYAKAAFSDILKNKYASISQLNAAWETNIDSWEIFDAGIDITKFGDLIVGDLSMLLEVFAEQYFKIVDATIEKHLPNHLYMGARMASWGMPPETIKAAISHSDVMSFNIYEEGLRKGGWDFFSEIDKPVVIGEFHIGAGQDTGLHHPGLTHAANQADRARMYKAYMESVTTNPYLVGAHWFQYVDSPLAGRAFDGENYNVGFVSSTDIPYPEMVEAARDIMRDIYPKRYNQE